jgi:hypothetical protein
MRALEEPQLQLGADVPRVYESGVDDDAATVLHPSTSKVPVPAVPIPIPISSTMPAPPIPERRFDSPRIVALVVVATLAVATFVAFLESLR